MSGGGHSIGPPVRIKVERFCARLAPSRTNSPTGGSKRAPGRREEPPGPSSHRSSVRFSEAGSTRPASVSSRAPNRAPWASKWRGPSPEGLAPRWADTAHLELGQPAGSRCPVPEASTVGPRCDRLIDESVHPCGPTRWLSPLLSGRQDLQCTAYQCTVSFVSDRGYISHERTAAGAIVLGTTPCCRVASTAL